MITRRTALLALALLSAAPLGAQLPNASAAAFGMGESYTAAARGADAAAWNPANLGLRDNPAFSLRALAAGGLSGLDPVSWNDLSSYGDRTVPRDVRLGWLDRVSAAGAQTGDANGGVTLLALSAGRLALHLAAAGGASASLSPDAMEALFFGNAGRTGEPRELHLAGSSVRASAFATGAVSYAQPLPSVAGGRLALGVTAKYVRGGGMLRAEDAGSAVTSSDVNVRFPVVHSVDANAGSGVGADVGLAWQRGRVTLGARAENVLNTFAWDTSALRFRPGAASFDGSTSSSDFDERTFAEAPAALRERVTGESFAPALGAGLAFQGAHALLVTVDARHAFGDANAIVLGPATHVGVGVESRALGVLPLRAGAAYVTGGWQASAGTGIRLGAYELAASVAERQGDHGRATGVMLNVIGVR